MYGRSSYTFPRIFASLARDASLFQTCTTSSRSRTLTLTPTTSSSGKHREKQPHQCQTGDKFYIDAMAIFETEGLHLRHSNLQTAPQQQQVTILSKLQTETCKEKIISITNESFLLLCEKKLNRAQLTVLSFGIFIFHTPPFALLSSSLVE